VRLELVVGEQRVGVHAARVAEVLPALELHKLHRPELKGQQAHDVEGQVHLGGRVVPEDVGAHDLLRGGRAAAHKVVAHEVVVFEGGGGLFVSAGGDG
jgi:hypothetical protein